MWNHEYKLIYLKMKQSLITWNNDKWFKEIHLNIENKNML